MTINRLAARMHLPIGMTSLSGEETTTRGEGLLSGD
jgi:hypothetical protein